MSGVGGYGNSLGLPNIGGELVFDSSYQGNPSSTRCASACCATRTSTSPTPRASATRSCCSAPARAATASAAPRSSPRRRSRTACPPSARASRWATPSWRRSSSSAASSSTRRRSWRASGPRCRRHLVRDVGARLERRRRHARVARRRPAARPDAQRGRDPHVGVAGAHDGGRRAGEARRVPRHHRQVGRRDRRHRRGQRLRAPDDRPPRRAHRRRRPADRRARARCTTARTRARRGRTGSTPAPWTPTLSPDPESGDELRATALRLLASPNLASRSG